MISVIDSMKWLFVTTQFPWPVTHGQWLRVYHLVRALRRQGDSVALLTCRDAAETDEGVAAYQEIGAEILEGPVRKHRHKGRPRSFLGPYAFDQDMADAVAQHSRSMDAVVLSHSRMLQYSREAAHSGCVIADIGDDPVLEYSRRQQLGTATSGMLWRMRTRLGRVHYERQGLANVTAATFVSDADAKSFARRHPDLETRCISNGVDAAYFCRPNHHQNNISSPTLVFTGHMGNPNNRWAAEYLVRSIAPLVWSKHRNLSIQIVGADPTEDVLSLAGERVEVTGTVPDIRPYLWNATLVTLPMQSGTGIKNKLLEAWAAGAAVVATPLACQGVDARDGENLAIAASAEQFAAKIIELLSDDQQRARLGADGRRTVEQGFSWDAAAVQLRQVACSLAVATAATQS